MDVASSLRLFGGKRRLVERVKHDCIDLGVRQLSWAPTSLAAVALARAGQSNGFARPLAHLLDDLPIETLCAVAAHAATLHRIGCTTLGQVRALPRGGLGRRFDAGLLADLDQAYGLRPEAHDWATIPDTFSARLELMSRVELAPALLYGARRLLLLMAGWLAARHAGVTAYTLHWQHDAMRSRSAGQGGEITIRTARPTRDIEHLTRLLAEHLAKVELLAPVGDLRLVADEVVALDEKSLSLLPEPVDAGESLALVLERISARLGPGSVLRPVVQEDHRLEWMCVWQPAPQPRPKASARCVDIRAAHLHPARAAAPGHARRAPAVPGRAAAARRPAPGGRRLVGPHRRRRCRHHAPGGARLLGGAERIRRCAVGVPDAACGRRERVVPAWQLCLKTGAARVATRTSSDILRPPKFGLRCWCRMRRMRTPASSAR